MSRVSQHQETLLSQVKAPLWGGYVNMLKTLESVFPSPRHWVLEFLQNSEDAMRTKGDRISIRLGEQSLWILNNGDDFSDEDFAAVCDVNSRKLPSLGFRGYIGIGFKSIFRITDRIEVHSGALHFAFDKNYWDAAKRGGMPLTKWPWEILPIPVKPVKLPDGYTTGFFIPLQSIKGQETLQEIDSFLSSQDFPKEVVLLLKNMKIIEIQTEKLSFTIAKEQKESASIPDGEKESVLVKRQIGGNPHIDEGWYLVFRRRVQIPPDVREESETERVRRSDITEREIGLVFALDSDAGKIEALYGKLAGVYSFLPVEGEQTGLPFGIFGDFIPQVGRDLIDYSVKWNRWMCDRVVDFLRQIVNDVFLPSPEWVHYPADLLDEIQYTSASGPGANFWNARLMDPIKNFLETERLYLDDKGKPQKLADLIVVDKQIATVVGTHLLEEAIGKRVCHPEVENKIRQKVESVGIYEILSKKTVLESLKADRQKLILLYELIESLNPYYIRGRDKKDTSLSLLRFVLGEDGQLHAPNDVITFKVALSSLPSFLKSAAATDKQFLHPDIAKHEGAVQQLERCGMEVVNEETLLRKTLKLVNSIKGPSACPPSWQYPDDLVKAHLFLFSKGTREVDMLVAEDQSMQAPKNTFLPGSPLDWSVLWKSGSLAPGYFPVHEQYLRTIGEFGIQCEMLHQCFEELGVHGFRPDRDDPIIEHTSYRIAEKRLRDKGHTIANVHDHTELGYDLECQGHCEKVFEVKGMVQPRDVPLEESQVIAARQKKGQYILVCVYNLPAHPDKVGYRETPNPEKTWIPVEKAKVPKEKWLLL